MNNLGLDEYSSETVSIPGATLVEILEERGMSQAELSERTGRPRKTINEILKGKTSITAETALQLERVLGIPASFWCNRQREYDEYLARSRETQLLEQFVPWLESFPCLQDMVKNGWLPARKKPTMKLDALLTFFGVNLPAEWDEVWSKPKLQAALRDSAANQSNPFALAAYLRRSEILAAEIECGTFSKVKFRQALENIRAAMIDDIAVLPGRIVDICVQAGVAVVFLPLVKGVHISGAVRWLPQDKPLLALSLRGRNEDKVWFSFFHEAGHILLHGKKSIYIESDEAKSEEENEADDFSREFLIPGKVWKTFIGKRHTFTEEEVRSFASTLKIPPAIVIGRLQHEKLIPQNSHLNSIKRPFVFPEVIYTTQV